MVTIVIFDDEEPCIAALRPQVERCMPMGVDYEIAEATTLQQLTELLASDTRIDILISDVIMPEGQPSGIDVVRRLFPAESGTQVIFMSGYLEQAP